MRCGSHRKRYLPGFSMIVNDFLPTKSTAVETSTLEPARWKLWMPGLVVDLEDVRAGGKRRHRLAALRQGDGEAGPDRPVERRATARPGCRLRRGGRGGGVLLELLLPPQPAAVSPTPARRPSRTECLSIMDISCLAGTTRPWRVRP